MALKRKQKQMSAVDQFTGIGLAALGGAMFPINIILAVLLIGLAVMWQNGWLFD